MAAEEDQQQLLKIRQERVNRLRVVDRQIEMFGPPYAPSHLLVEQEQLRREIGIADTAISSPATTAIGDEMGAGARFLVYYEQMRRLEENDRELSKQLDQLSRWLWRFGLLLAALMLIVSVLATVVIVR